MQSGLEFGNTPKPDAVSAGVSRVHESSLTAQSFFEHYRSRGRPVIITGLLNADSTWNLDYLRKTLGTCEVSFRSYEHQKYQPDKRQWREIGRGTEPQLASFDEFADLLQSLEAREKDIYLSGCSLNNTPLATHPLLQRAEQKLKLRMPATGFNLFVGVGGHTTCLHYDPVDGLLMQLFGSKKIVLFPPSQLENLYPFPISVHLQHGLRLRASYSQVHPEQPDFAVFPRLKQALKYRFDVVLKQGEVLYLPANWWHEITTLGTGMVCSVNRFWHVHPCSPEAWSWRKWRVHLGSALAVPHTLRKWWLAEDRGEKHRQLRRFLLKI